MKKMIALLLALCMTVSLAACGSTTSDNSSGSGDSSSETSNASSEDGSESASSSTTEGETDSDTELYPSLTVAVSTDWKDLEPESPNQDGKYTFIYNIYESLFDLDDAGGLVGNLATGYEEVDGYTWVVDIYDCIYDSDGNHITASDVVFSVNWLIDSGNALGYDAFESIEATGDYQVTWHFTEEMTGVKSLEQYFLRTLIFSETAYNEHNFATDPVGTGNYKVTNLVTGSTLTMEARDDYWGSDPEIQAERMEYHTATVQSVTLQIISEAANAAVALEMGTVDMCAYVSSDLLYEFEEGGQYSDQYTVFEAMSSDHFILNANCDDSSIGLDTNLMLAIFYALENESIATAMGSGYTAMKGLGFSYFGDYNPEWDEEANYVNTYDPELAAEYLEQSDYNGETLEMIGLNTEVAKNAMTMIQTQLEQIGIHVSINAYDQNTLGATMAERTGWDIAMNMAGGTSFAGTFGAFNLNINDGYNKYWNDDETLDNLRIVMNTDETHDDEHVKEFIDYVYENAYQYGIAIATSSIVATSDMTELYLREGYFTPCACQFN
ncbi:MAG: ABC transporter substrate-binding protein [Clostridiales bacterium]|nr:ABC transporter substrate-binding protein [Clostridiales bacterium]